MSVLTFSGCVTASCWATGVSNRLDLSLSSCFAGKLAYHEPAPVLSAQRVGVEPQVEHYLSTTGYYNSSVIGSWDKEGLVQFSWNHRLQGKNHLDHKHACLFFISISLNTFTYTFCLQSLIRINKKITYQKAEKRWRFSWSRGWLTANSFVKLSYRGYPFSGWTLPPCFLSTLLNVDVCVW